MQSRLLLIMSCLGVLHYRARGRLMKEVHELFEGLDALVLPARGRGEEGAMGNVLGLPQIVFPTGYSPLSGNVQSSRKDPKAQVWLAIANRSFWNE